MTKFATVWIPVLVMAAHSVAQAQPVDSRRVESSTTMADALPGTSKLTLTGDIASQLVDGVDRFLLDQLAGSVAKRARHWNRDFSSAAAYQASVEKNRVELARILGVVDQRPDDTEPNFVAQPSRPPIVGGGAGFDAYAVTWPAFGEVEAAGLLLEPKTGSAVANVVAIPDCQQLPEHIVGLVPGTPPEAQYARRLAESGCRVLVPLLINREEKLANLTNREWLYRSAFEMGRGLVGYEVQQVLAAVDWFAGEKLEPSKIGVMGWGEGAMIALYAAALDPRIDAALVSGYFQSRQKIWQEPLDRNVFGLLDKFGDAELASLVAPRKLIIEACRGPELTLPGGRGAPAKLDSPSLADVRREFQRAEQLIRELPEPLPLELVVSGEGQGHCGSEVALKKLLDELNVQNGLAALGEPPVYLKNSLSRNEDVNEDLIARQQAQINQLDRHTQQLLRRSHYVRQENTVSRFNFKSIKDYRESADLVRREFYDEVIGRFDQELLPANPRTRRLADANGWTGYEVVLDVYPGVIAYGLLLVPGDISQGEKRPVVVCQHGLEGRPQHTIGDEGSQYYAAFAARLAGRGFITFAPQNLYIFGDRFRTLQRKANPLGKSLFSIITPQHQQIVDWLQTLPFVDPDRIGFYGLSYGGKTAMRVPALVPDYCLSICSADFNEWVDKNASTLNPRSYVNSGEYEIFEFDLGGRFNYAEMAHLIAPRPFMVERGHFDGVADDWTVAYEFAKVRHLYAAKLKIPEKTEIEWFDGPHRINGHGTFEFLHKHLDWPKNSKLKLPQDR